MPISPTLPQSGLRPAFVYPHPLITVVCAGSTLGFAYWQVTNADYRFAAPALAVAFVMAIVAQASIRRRAQSQPAARLKLLRAKAAQRVLNFDELKNG